MTNINGAPCGSRASNLREIAVDDERTLILLCTLAATARAELPEQSSEASSERVYRTGSNIPVHERTPYGRVITLDRDAAEDLMRRNQQVQLPTSVKGAK